MMRRVKMLIWDEDYKELIRFLKKQKEIPFIICDENTYEACGKDIEEKLKEEKIFYDIIILSKNAHADEKNICKVLIKTKENFLTISVGSGSITDLSRFIAYKQKLRFISIPTAPSMDGYASSVAPLTIDGLKLTVPAIPPEKIFVNMEVIENSPKILTIAGFGDLMGKYSALLDWQVSHILTEEKIDMDIVKEMMEICDKTLESLKEKDFKKSLIYGLIRSGELMTIVGSSRPASGSEHHVAHYLEYKGYDIYHGIKVGLSEIYILRLYEEFLKITEEDLEKAKNYRIDEEKWKKEIKKEFPEIFERIKEEYKERIREINDRDYRRKFIERLKKNKEKIDNLIRETLKKKEKVLKGYKEIGFSIKIEDWGIDKEDMKSALLHALYIRERFTILSLYRFLGFLEEMVEKVIERNHEN